MSPRPREASGQRWQGQGGVRSYRAGTAFALTHAPRNAAGVEDFLLLSLHHAGINNLPDTVRDGLVEVLGPAPGWPSPPATAALDGAATQGLWDHADAHGYANAFQAVPRPLPWHPRLVDDTGARLNPRPTAPGYQSALVVADAGGHDVLSSDAQGRRSADSQGRGDAPYLRAQARWAGIPGTSVDNMLLYDSQLMRDAKMIATTSGRVGQRPRRHYAGLVQAYEDAFLHNPGLRPAPFQARPAGFLFSRSSAQYCRTPHARPLRHSAARGAGR